MIDYRTFFSKVKRLSVVPKNNKKRFLLFAVLIVAPVIFVGGFSVKKEYEHLSSEIFSHARGSANLAAVIVEGELDHLVDVGTLIAKHPSVIKAAEAGRWQDIEVSIHGMIDDFPIINSIAVLDKEANLKVIIPASPNIIGQNFAYQDYYQMVSVDWVPHVSPVFKKSGGDQGGIVGVVVPIWSIDKTRVTGILCIGIKLSSIAEWSKDFITENGEASFIVDQKEQSITSNGQRELIKSNVLLEAIKYQAVHEASNARIERGQDGGGSFLVAHAPVPRYGWGVAMVTPSNVAFASRTEELVRITTPWGLALLFIVVLFYIMLRDREELRAERDHEQMFLDSIGDGVVAIDRNWNITLWNRAACHISGWQKEEVMGKPFRSAVKFLRETGREEYFSFIEEAIVSGNVQSLERGFVLVRKDGSEVAISDSAASVVNANGESEGAIIVFHDVSKERDTERLRSDFAYAAHQLRTPVTEALWNIETAQKQRDTKKRNESLDIAHDAILSVKDLEEHLISVSEIDKGIVVPWVAPVDTKKVVEEIVKKLSRRAKERKVTISIDTSRSPEAINTDSKLLKAILFELLENAVLYNREGGISTVRVSPQDGNLIFEIMDQGIGIPLEDQAIIFTKFFRGSNRDIRVAGSGLGLYVAKEYTRILDGKIWFKSEEGRGTTFYVSIPIR